MNEEAANAGGIVVSQEDAGRLADLLSEVAQLVVGLGQDMRATRDMVEELRVTPPGVGLSIPRPRGEVLDARRRAS